MSSLRQGSVFSISQHVGQHARHNSISAQDMPALAQVQTRVVEDAAKAAVAERSMSLRAGFKTYPKAIMWSILISTCIIMEGFDIVLVNSLFALPAFQKQFGTQLSDGSYSISAAWQSGLANAAIVGEISGLFAVGWLAERWGYRRTLIAALCLVIGQFLASGVLKGVSTRTDPFGYKLPYGLQWMWPVPLIICIALAPESPWWLVRRGRKEEAKHSLLRLTSRGKSVNVEDIISMMIYTTELERANTEGARYLDCFKGVDLQRTEIVCIVWSIQTLCGSSSLTGFSTYFFEQAGLNKSDAFSLTLAQYALGFIGTIASWFLMSKCGRRTLYLYGQIAMVALLIIIGLLAIPKHNEGAHWGIGAMLMFYNLVYNLTVGPVCYSLVAELASTRLRNKTVVIARNLYNITTIVANVLAPRMLNPKAWHWGAKAGFFWAGSCTLCAIWTYFRLPEPKGRLYVELDMLFHAKVSARKFSTTPVVSLAADGFQLPDENRRNTDAKIEVYEMQRVISGSSSST